MSDQTAPDSAHARACDAVERALATMFGETWLERCDWCCFPLDPEGKMCRADNCSMRPRPLRPDVEQRQLLRAALPVLRATVLRAGRIEAALRDALAAWTFDAAQAPTHTWHDREDWIARNREALEELR